MGLRSLVKTNSGLMSGTTEELRSQGVTVPTTPIMADVKGLTSKSSDMMGTAANKLKTLQESVKKVQEADKETPESYAEKKTAATEAAQSVIPSLENLPKINDNVKNLIVKKMVNEATGTADPAKVTAAIDTTALNELVPAGATADIPKATASLQKIASGNITPDTIAELNAALGRSSSDFLTPLQLSTLFKGPDATALAKTVTDATSNYDKQTLGNIGMSNKDLEDIAQATGKTAEEVSAMTYADYKNSLSSVRNSYQTTANLNAIANDPNVGAAQRLDAQESLRETGVIGKRQAEEKVNNIIAQVEDNDKITLAGKEMSIKEVLEDEFMSGFIKDAVEGGEEELANLEEIAPTLGAWVRANLDAVSKLVKDIDVPIADAKAEVWKKENPVIVALGGDINNQTPIPGLAAIPEDKALQQSMVKWLPDAKAGGYVNAFTSSVNTINDLVSQAAANGIKPSEDPTNLVGRLLWDLTHSASIPTQAKLDTVTSQIADYNLLNTPGTSLSSSPSIPVVNDQISSKIPTENEKVKILMAANIPTNVINTIKRLKFPVTEDSLRATAKPLIASGNTIAELNAGLTALGEGLKMYKTPAQKVADADAATTAKFLADQKLKKIVENQELATYNKMLADRGYEPVKKKGDPLIKTQSTLAREKEEKEAIIISKWKNKNIEGEAGKSEARSMSNAVGPSIQGMSNAELMALPLNKRLVEPYRSIIKSRGL